jgi:hypothetical protein
MQQRAKLHQQATAALARNCLEIARRPQSNYSKQLHQATTASNYSKQLTQQALQATTLASNYISKQLQQQALHATTLARNYNIEQLQHKATKASN